MFFKFLSTSGYAPASSAREDPLNCTACHVLCLHATIQHPIHTRQRANNLAGLLWNFLWGFPLTRGSHACMYPFSIWLADHSCMPSYGDHMSSCTYSSLACMPAWRAVRHSLLLHMRSCTTPGPFLPHATLHLIQACLRVHMKTYLQSVP